MAYKRYWNDKWQAGTEVHYFGAYDQNEKHPVVAKILRISPKLGHATVEVPLSDGSLGTKELVFELDTQEYAYTVRSGSYMSRYRACIRLITSEYLAQRAAKDLLQLRKDRQAMLLSKMQEYCKYRVLSSTQLDTLSELVDATSVAQENN